VTGHAGLPGPGGYLAPARRFERRRVVLVSAEQATGCGFSVVGSENQYFARSVLAGPTHYSDGLAGRALFFEAPTPLLPLLGHLLTGDYTIWHRTR